MDTQTGFCRALFLFFPKKGTSNFSGLLLRGIDLYFKKNMTASFNCLQRSDSNELDYKGFFGPANRIAFRKYSSISGKWMEKMAIPIRR